MMQRFGVYWSIMEGVAVTQKQAAHSIFWLSGRGGVVADAESSEASGPG